MENVAEENCCSIKNLSLELESKIKLKAPKRYKVKQKISSDNSDELREACGIFGCVLSSCTESNKDEQCAVGKDDTHADGKDDTHADGKDDTHADDQNVNGKDDQLAASKEDQNVNGSKDNESDSSGANSSTDETPEEVSEIVVSKLIHLGLIALQHRGQESAGIATSEGKSATNYKCHKGKGLATQVFNEQCLANLTGTVGIGHTRYTTAGGTDLINSQPFLVHTRHGQIAIAHNGELINAEALRETVLERGIGLSTESDSELITQVLSLTPPRGEKKGPDWPARIRHLMEATPLAYSLVLMYGDKIYAVRDAFGNRPLCVGKLDSLRNYGNKDSAEQNGPPLGWVVSSESCAFQSVGAKHIRDVQPGEILEISPLGIRTVDIVSRPKTSNYMSQTLETQRVVNDTPSKFCIFEYVYFSRPDSIYEGQQVYSVRFRSGVQLAIEAPVDADIVSTVPESATPAALGFAQETKIPYVEVLCKNRYIGRSFIQPCARSRKLAVAKKFGAISENLRGKRVVIIDDSIVRGNTVKPIIKLLRNAGAKEVHIRVASPPIKHPCYMGINIPTKTELIANKCNIEDLAKHFGADSLKYLSIDGLKKAVRQGITNDDMSNVGHCTACLDANYPVNLEW